MTSRYKLLRLTSISLLALNLCALVALASNDEFNLELSNEVRTALDAGVVLSFNCRYAVRDSWWALIKGQSTRTHRFTLTRHALSNRYIVKVDATDTPHISRSVTEATNFITTQARKRLDLYNTPEHHYSMRLSLNKFELPTPMRLKAFVDSAWDIDTGWVAWKSAS